MKRNNDTIRSPRKCYLLFDAKIFARESVHRLFHQNLRVGQAKKVYTRHTLCVCVCVCVRP